VSAAALLVELAGVGIHLTGEGDNLRVRAEPGISLSPYLERIKPHKSALLKALLQRQIVAALDVTRQGFDRAEYDRLWMLWHTQDAKEESTP
jgi:hypothetical protein